MIDLGNISFSQVKLVPSSNSYSRVDHEKISLQRQKVDALLGIAKPVESVQQNQEPIIAIPVSDAESPIRYTGVSILIS